MDVTPWIPDDFWREWRTAVKQAKPDAVAVAETFFDASKYFLGDEFDSTMNYIFRSSVVAYANGAKAGDIYRNIELMRENYPPQAFYALMNLIDSHDSARALHDFGWRDEAKDSAETVALAKRRLRLAAFFQMTSPGAPAIYYGDEVGVTGGDDPFDRGTYPWPDLGGKPDEALLAEYKKLTRLRHAESVLRRGSLDAPIYIDDRVIVLARRDGARWALVAMNNDAAPRTLKVRLPAAIATAHFRDALTGARLAAAAGTLELTVPAMYGSVLLSHSSAPASNARSGKVKSAALRSLKPPGGEIVWRARFAEAVLSLRVRRSEPKRAAPHARVGTYRRVQSAAADRTAALAERQRLLCDRRCTDRIPMRSCRICRGASRPLNPVNFSAYPGNYLEMPAPVAARLGDFFSEHLRRAFDARRILHMQCRLSLVTLPPQALRPYQSICHADGQISTHATASRPRCSICSRTKLSAAPVSTSRHVRRRKPPHYSATRLRCRPRRLRASTASPRATSTSRMTGSCISAASRRNGTASSSTTAACCTPATSSRRTGSAPIRCAAASR